MVADILEALSSDFWVQLASALIASLLTLLIQPNWYKSFKRSDPAAEKSSPRTYVEAPKAKFEGAGHIPSKNPQITQHINVRQNIYNSPTYRQNGEDTVGLIVLVLIAAILASILFALTGFFLQWVSFGVLLGLLILCLFAIFTTTKQKLWDMQAWATVFLSAMSSVTTIATWVGIHRFEHEGMTFETVTASVRAAATEGAAEDAGLVVILADHMVPAFFGAHETVLIFVLCILVAVCFQAMQLFFAVIAVVNWQAYLSFSEKPQRGKFTTSRAQRYLEGQPRDLILPGIILTAGALVFSQGLAFEFWLDPNISSIL